MPFSQLINPHVHAGLARHNTSNDHTVLINEMYKAGLSMREIALRIGKGYNYVQRRVEVHNKRKFTYFKSKKERHTHQMVFMHKWGFDIKEIANLFHLSEKEVFCRIREHGRKND